MPLECRSRAPRMPNKGIKCAPGLPRKTQLSTGRCGKSAPRMPTRAAPGARIFRADEAAVARIWERIKGLGAPEEPKPEQATKPKAKKNAKGGAQSPKG